MVNKARWVAALLVALGFLWGTGRAADPAPEEQTGVKVGEKAPPFKLKDQKGEERSLEEFLKRGKVALVFYRSADW
jgi:cytochrome oxidase Cu insertion factor (SCO1/SenC/PrrC family)